MPAVPAWRCQCCGDVFQTRQRPWDPIRVCSFEGCTWVGTLLQECPEHPGYDDDGCKNDLEPDMYDDSQVSMACRRR